MPSTMLRWWQDLLSGSLVEYQGDPSSVFSQASRGPKIPRTARGSGNGERIPKGSLGISIENEDDTASRLLSLRTTPRYTTTHSVGAAGGRPEAFGFGSAVFGALPSWLRSKSRNKAKSLRPTNTTGKTTLVEASIYARARPDDGRNDIARTQRRGVILGKPRPARSTRKRS